MKQLLIILCAAALFSCEKPSGCGEVLDKRVDYNLECQLYVDLPSGAKWCTVGTSAYAEFDRGEIVCFD